MPDLRPRVHFISLGCDKNLVDSEKALGLLIDAGFIYTAFPEKAEVIIINTCCFIRDARDESIEKLIEMADLKSGMGGTGPLIIVMGCMAERYKEEITASLPEVDAIIGTNSWQDIVSTAKKALARRKAGSGEKLSVFAPVSDNTFKSRPVTGRLLTGGSHYAYLKIAEGCGKNCTYCIIPSLKGAYRSAPLDDLVLEAGKLAEEGVKELILIAQETTLYGTDLYGKKCLPDLLKRLDGIDGIEWIRIMYCYPEEITDELIAAMKSLPKVVHYLDMPIQHASDHILRRMGRKARHDGLISLIGKLRGEMPDIVLRTSLIAGFPGETPKDHEILIEFVRKMEFDRLGCFEYSREEGTRAYGYSHQVPAKTKKKRREELMEVQQEIALKKASAMRGRTFRVLIEGRLTEGAFQGTGAVPTGNIYAGRTYMDAPDVDGMIYIDTGSRTFMTGDMVNVKVTASEGYDLSGVLV